MREVHQETNTGKAEQFGVRTQQFQRCKRIGARPAETVATFGWQRFRQDEIAVRSIADTERGSDPERHARTEFTELAAKCRADDESETEGGTEHAEARCALLR